MFGNIDPLAATTLLDKKTKNDFIARVKNIRIHDFKHSCASLLIDSGATVPTVSKFLEHTKIEETLNTYTHLFGSALNSVVNVIDNLDNNKTED